MKSQNVETLLLNRLRTYVLTYLLTKGRWDDNPVNLEEKSIDHRKLIFDLPVGFKSTWNAGSVWPIFTAVRLQFPTEFVFFLFLFYSLKLWVWGL